MAIQNTNHLQGVQGMMELSQNDSALNTTLKEVLMHTVIIK